MEKGHFTLLVLVCPASGLAGHSIFIFAPLVKNW